MISPYFSIKKCTGPVCKPRHEIDDYIADKKLRFAGIVTNVFIDFQNIEQPITSLPDWNLIDFSLEDLSRNI
jgi:hypothetical protein